MSVMSRQTVYIVWLTVAEIFLLIICAVQFGFEGALMWFFHILFLVVENPKQRRGRLFRRYETREEKLPFVKR